LISGVTCDAPYEWSDKTDSEWEFKKNQSSESFHVSIVTLFSVHPEEMSYLILASFSFIGGCL
jgi:hypothetical protein